MDKKFSFSPSFWEKESFLKEFDFLVLGSGIVGKQIAIGLKNKYKNSRIGIIDRAPFPYGASTRNAGFACFGTLGEWQMDIENSSEDKILNLSYERFKGIQKLKELVDINDFDFNNFGGYEVFKTKTEFENVNSFYNKIKDKISSKFGNYLFKEIDISNLNSGFYGKAFYNSFESQIHSGKLLFKLEEKIQFMNIQAIYGCEILDFENENNVVKLNSKNGLNFKTQKLIIANNAFAKLILPNLDIKPARGQVLITKPIENLKIRGNYHYDGGYIYFRNVENRLLIGGARNKFFKEEESFEIKINSSVIDYLKSFVSENILLNLNFEIDTSWSGIMAMGKDKSPIVEKQSDNIYLAVRMGGMGVALSSVVAEKVINLII